MRDVLDTYAGSKSLRRDTDPAIKSSTPVIRDSTFENSSKHFRSYSTFSKQQQKLRKSKTLKADSIL